MFSQFHSESPWNLERPIYQSFPSVYENKVTEENCTNLLPICPKNVPFYYFLTRKAKVLLVGNKKWHLRTAPQTLDWRAILPIVHVAFTLNNGHCGRCARSVSAALHSSEGALVRAHSAAPASTSRAHSCPRQQLLAGRWGWRDSGPNTRSPFVAALFSSWDDGGWCVGSFLPRCHGRHLVHLHTQLTLPPHPHCQLFIFSFFFLEPSVNITLLLKKCQ